MIEYAPVGAAAQVGGLELRATPPRRPRIWVRGFAALVAITAFSAVMLLDPTLAAAQAPPPEPSGIAVQLIDIPEATQQDPRARSYIVDRAAPGSTIERRIEVQNTSDQPQTVRIYPGAATIEEGVFTGGSDPAENELTSWMSVGDESVDLPPRASAKVLVTIEVPPDASETEHYGAIWAEVRSGSGDGSAVIQASRVGIRIYLSVGPGNGAPADFGISALTASKDADGIPRIAANVTNTGGRAVDVTGELWLEGGPGGLSAGPFTLQQPTTISPGNTGMVTLTLNAELPDGPWDARLILRSGLLERETSASVVFPATGESIDVVQERPIPWLMLVTITTGILLAALIAALLWSRRNRVRRQGAGHSRRAFR